MGGISHNLVVEQITISNRKNRIGAGVGWGGVVKHLELKSLRDPDDLGQPFP